MSEISKTKRIATNTVLLYIRMFVVMIISLITVRVVLRSLGAEDYGIYNVISGVIAMVSFVGTAMSAATQRFYSYAIGEGDEQQQRKIFSASLVIYIFLAIALVLIIEIAGIWLINHKLVIPESRLFASRTLFQFTVLSFVVSILTIPFSAVVIAHERMGYYAIVSTLECVLKLVAALLLVKTSNDKLIFYGATLFLAHGIITLMYIIYDRLNFRKVCQFSYVRDWSLYKSIISFSGWSLFGTAAGVFVNQGNTLLVNIFFGPIVNASRAISFQISNTLVSFANSFSMSISPPIVKSYAERNDDYLMNLFYFGNKFIFYLMLLICVPLFFEVETILKLWIGIYETNMIVFSRWMIIYTLCMVLHAPISMIIQATGRVKRYNLVVESFTLMTVPVTYIAFKIGYSATSTFIIITIAIIVSHIARIIILQLEYKPFKISLYIKEFVIPAMFVTLVVVVVIMMLRLLSLDDYSRLIVVVIVSMLLTGLLSFYFALNKKERTLLLSFASGILKNNR